MAKVLKVVMSVVAPEKSIVPWAWATPASESARNVGHSACAALRRLCLERGCANRLARRVVLWRGMILLRGNIGTSGGPVRAGICRDHWRKMILRPIRSIYRPIVRSYRPPLSGVNSATFRDEAITGLASYLLLRPCLSG